MNRIKELRTQRGFSHFSLARRSGVQQGHISQLERGQRNPSPITRQKLALTLGCNLDELAAVVAERAGSNAA